MSQDVKLSTFPSNRTEALTMLYLQNQDLSDKSPSEIVDLYLSTKKEITETLRNTPRESIKW